VGGSAEHQTICHVPYYYKSRHTYERVMSHTRLRWSNTLSDEKIRQNVSSAGRALSQ